MRLKSLLTSAVCIAAISLAGCAGAQTAPAGLDFSKLPIAKFAHADLQNAAALATQNGYPARAAVWLAHDQVLTAIEAQASACAAAIAAAAPKAPAAGGTVGAATLLEQGAEAVGQGIPAAVKINCGAITLP